MIPLQILRRSMLRPKQDVPGSPTVARHRDGRLDCVPLPTAADRQARPTAAEIEAPAGNEADATTEPERHLRRSVRVLHRSALFRRCRDRERIGCARANRPFGLLPRAACRLPPCSVERRQREDLPEGSVDDEAAKTVEPEAHRRASSLVNSPLRRFPAPLDQPQR